MRAERPWACTISAYSDPARVATDKAVSILAHSAQTSQRAWNRSHQTKAVDGQMMNESKQQYQCGRN
jgi:hypothetical protein